MTKKKLLIDGQVFQTSARDRGMGRYAVCLVAELLRKKEHDIEIILTTNLPFGASDQKELKALLPGAKFKRLDLWTTKNHAIEEAFKHNEAVLNDRVSEAAGQNTDYFIPSLFQEPIVAVFPRHVRAKTVLFHDLIPYHYHGRYRPVMLWENYLKRFRYIFEADLIFTNSQTVADDLHVYLGVPKQRLCRIDGAAIHTDTAVEEPTQPSLKGASFILFNTSDDPRKNNLRTVLGFEEWRIAAGSDCKLVLTSTIGQREQDHLGHFSKHLLFTGNIPERQLNWLYKHCELLLFPSENEGLGLPALEAVDANKKVVCSSISVLQEINPEQDAFYYCDHENSYSIAQALERAMAPGGTINQLAYKKIRAYYSWTKTADRMLAGLKSWVPRPTAKRPKIALFTATPSGLSGVGVTTATLHPALTSYFEVDYFIEPGLSKAEIRPDYLKYVAPCYPARSFSVQDYQRYDAVVYHMGNGEYHLESIKNALYLPGYIIVHDTHMREAYRVLNEANMMDAARVKLEEAIDLAAGTKNSSYFTSVANRQLGIITHSHYAKAAMEEVLAGNKVPILKAHLPTSIPDLPNIRVSEKVTIGLAGAIADVKGVDVIEAIAEEADFANCDIRLFGFNHASQETIDKLNSYDNVSVATNVSDFDFQMNIKKLNIFVNYRHIYKGETSNTTLESMRQGVVTIVRNVGWYSELPDNVVIKVDTPEQVFDELRKLVKDPARMQQIGDRAKAYVMANFTQEAYAKALYEMITKPAANNPNALIAGALKQGSVVTASQLQATIGGQRAD